MHRGVARILGRLDEETRAATRALAADQQAEYEDEYDDSFDDLQRGGKAAPPRAFVAAWVECVRWWRNSRQSVSASTTPPVTTCSVEAGAGPSLLRAWWGVSSSMGA